MKRKQSETTTNHILSFFIFSPKKKFNYRQILSKLPYEISKNKIKEILFLLEKEKKIQQLHPGSYRLLKKTNILIGTVDKTNKGSGYIIQKNVEKDVYVSDKHMLNSFDGDIVEFEMISAREAKIINIKERRKSRFVGIIRKKEKKVFVYTTGKKDKVEFYITNKTRAEENEIVVVEFKKWENEYPEAEIIKRIGKQGEVDNEIHAILEEYSLPYKFSKENIKEAEELSRLQSKEEYKKRKDLRNITTLTIDPEDAKDFDDAISVEEKEKETNIGIHIADVSHFLKKGTDLDKEAYLRGTSVYLVDRVVPMLPESLSNNL
ncbi:MAG: RNB domain-containing ribonuclease, partial [Pelagibacterales bacterium]|nr:RNB domain-containing ribonuclease [Pelagibacterales bacterium]